MSKKLGRNSPCLCGSGKKQQKSAAAQKRGGEIRPSRFLPTPLLPTMGNPPHTPRYSRIVFLALLPTSGRAVKHGEGKGQGAQAGRGRRRYP